MIVPLDADKLGRVSRWGDYDYEIDWFNTGFYIMINGDVYSIYRIQEDSKIHWSWNRKKSLNRRSALTPADSDAQIREIVKILNDKDELGGLSIVEYIRHMGFDAYRPGWVARLLHYFKTPPRRSDNRKW